ncbi:MAG: MerR family transcriptional regulator [Bacteroidales bacterium]|nr:MerR family transcriptional regulator [Bacteroidales bacterium]
MNSYWSCRYCLPKQWIDPYMLKPGKIYYSIGEVARFFDVNPSLIRFWEREFDVLRPKKNKKGNRLFTEKDIRYLHIIYNLVKVKGYTLQGARDVIKHDIEQLEDQTFVLQALHNSLNFLQQLDAVLEQRAKNL